jgi:non-ribosomal peptide synthetase component F
MVVALLAILKAGGAYVPLDPAIRPSACASCWPTPASRCCSSTRTSARAARVARAARGARRARARALPADDLPARADGDDRPT